MLIVNMDGRLYNIKEMTSKNGKKYGTASLQDQVKGMDGNYVARYVDIVAFGTTAERLLGFKNGEAVSVNGPGELKLIRPREGDPRPGLQVIVNAIWDAPQSRIKDVSTSVSEEPLDAFAETAEDPRPVEKPVRKSPFG